MKTAKQNAFTLIELIVAVAIIGILSAIAIPSYTTFIEKSQQEEAKAALVTFASAMGQYYLDGSTYIGAGGSLATPSTTGDPWIFANDVPIDGGTKTYDLDIVSASAIAFQVRATPVDNNLETYCINELGTKDDCNGTSNW